MNKPSPWKYAQYITRQIGNELSKTNHRTALGITEIQRIVCSFLSPNPNMLGVKLDQVSCYGSGFKLLAIMQQVN
jgi:hypothetical protein